MATPKRNEFGQYTPDDTNSLPSPFEITPSTDVFGKKIELLAVRQDTDDADLPGTEKMEVLLSDDGSSDEDISDISDIGSIRVATLATAMSPATFGKRVGLITVRDDIRLTEIRKSEMVFSDAGSLADASTVAPISRQPSQIETSSSTDSFGKRIELVTISEESARDPQLPLDPSPDGIHDRRLEFWNPRSLSRLALTSFLILFLLILIGLQVVDSYAKKHRGLATTDQTKHFLWTFGPTSIFVVVAALWRQVDYQMKQIMPWAQLRKGPTFADDNLLLDYTSPLMAVSFVKSIAKRHFPVTLTILGFVLIKILMVLSTGLFVLQYVYITGRPVDLVTTDKFDGSGFAHGLNMDNRAFMAVYGAGDGGTMHILNVTGYYAVQSFQAASGAKLPSQAELVAPVDIFDADLDCETAEMSFLNATNDWTADTTLMEYQNLSVSAPSCEMSYDQLNVTEPAGIVHGGDYRSLFEVLECNGDTSNTSRRLLAAVFFIKEVENTQSMVNATALLCIPSYQISQGLAAISYTHSPDTETNVVSVDGKTTRELADLSALDILTGVQSSAAQAESVDNDQSSSALDSFMSVAFTRAGTDMSKFMSPSAMKTQVRELFRLTAAQVANQYLRVPDRQDVEGTFNHFGSLLVPRKVPLRVMQILLVFLIMATSLILFITPRDVLPRSAESIAGLATIVARSQEALKPLKGLGHVSQETLSVFLQSTAFKTSVLHKIDGPVFQIERFDGLGEKRMSNRTPRRPVGFSPAKWWRPTSFGYPAIVASLLLPLGLIAALQATLDRSINDDGLTDIDPSSGSRADWVYIPALVLVLTATLFNLLDFDVATIQPYHTLKRRDATARESIDQTPLLRVAIFRLYNRLTSRYIPVMVTAVAVIVAPILTIVVSGLLFLQQVPYSNSVGVQQQDWFNASLSGDFFPPEAAKTVNLIVHGNMSYPKWTHDELAFPKISLDQAADKSSHLYLDRAQYINMTFPALRGNLNCTPWHITKMENRSLADLPQFENNDTTSLGDEEPGHIFVDGPRILLTLPDDVTGNIALNGKPLSHYDFIFENVSSSDGNGFSAAADFSTGFLFFGQFKNHQLFNFTISHCRPFAESLQVQAVLNIQDFTFSTTALPEPLESTVRPWPSNPGNETDPNPDTATLNLAFSRLNINDGNTFSPFFQALIYGRDGVPASSLLNQTHLMSAANHLHRIVKTQTLNAYHRISSENTPPTLPATYTFTQRVRLQQRVLATRILQVLLVILLLCAMTVHGMIWYSTQGTRRVTPRNPHCIASVAALLAGAEMLREENVPRGAEWWGDKEGRERELWQGKEFGMGWWRKYQGIGSGRRRGGEKREREAEGETARSGDGTGPERFRFGIEILEGRGGPA